MIVIYTPRLTNRIQYIFDFVFRDYFGLPFTIITSPGEVTADKVFINYSNEPLPGYYSVFRDELLMSDKIEKQTVFVSKEKELPVFFQTTDHYDLQFDIFSAIFYLITRYEEYLPHEKDVHGRYRSGNSILAKEVFNFSPVVETWLLHLRSELHKINVSLQFREYHYEFEPTFDIDNAFAYDGRRWPKILASWLNSKTWKVLSKQETDPYDTKEDILFYLHKFKLRARFFFLMNDRGKFNSTVNPNSGLLHERIHDCTKHHGFGIHPSYRAYENDSLGKEKALLEEVTGVAAEHSRQHFLRIHFPAYYPWLISHEIYNDHSMGYPDVSGFRAGFSRPFYFFDLSRNSATRLTIHPFAFMDATYIYYQKPDINLIFKKNLQITEQVSKVNGKLVTISHNDLLGSGSQVNFWRVFENCAV